MIQISGDYVLTGNGYVHQSKNCGFHKLDELSNVKQIDNYGHKLGILTHKGEVFTYPCKNLQELFPKHNVIEIKFVLNGHLYALTSDNKILGTHSNMFDLNTLIFQ